MSDPYTQYLNSRIQSSNTSDPYTSYLESLNKNQPPAEDPYDAYLKALDTQSKSITPTAQEVEEMTPKPTRGFAGALWEGFTSGLTLGYAGQPHEGEMTTGELSGLLIGELAGGLGPLAVASSLTGGFGALAAGSGRVKRAYDLVSLIGRNGKKIQKYEKSISKLDKVKDKKIVDALGEKISVLSKDNFKYTKTLKDYKKDYIADVYNKTQSAKKAQEIAKTPLFQTASGWLGKSKSYQAAIKSVATNPKLGFQAANVLNKFANSAGAFAMTGVLRKRGEGPFGELEMADRLTGIPKDIWMGGLFTAAGVPSMLGMKGGNTINSAALLGLGAMSDYLTGTPTDMPVEERLMHGISLLAFHHVQHGLSNIGVKDKLFNGLKEMGFTSEQSFAIAYENPKFDGQLAKIREGETFRYRSRKDKDDWSIVEAEGAIKGKDSKGKEINKGGFIELRHVDTGVPKRFEGKTLREAKDKLFKEYERFDYRDPLLKDDIAGKKDVDFSNRMKDDIIGESIKKIDPKLQEQKQNLENKSRELLEVSKKQRIVEIKTKKAGELEDLKEVRPVYDARKDNKTLKEWESKELEYLETLKNENPDKPYSSFKDGKWPDKYNWITDENVRSTGWHGSVRSRLAAFIKNRSSEDGELSPKMLFDEINRIRRGFEKENRPVDSDYPINIRNSKVDDTIVIPKINRHRMKADEGTGKAFDYTEVQLGKIVKKDLTSKDGDKYVPVPDKSTVKIETVDLNSGETIQLNIRTRKPKDIESQADEIIENFLRQKAPKELKKKYNVRADWHGYWSLFNLHREKVYGKNYWESDKWISDKFSLDKWLESIGGPNRKQLINKLKDYKEPNLNSKEFLESNAKINPNIYDYPLFKDASTLVSSRATSEYFVPELSYITEKGNIVKFPLEKIGYKGEYIFDDLLEAHRKMNKIWSDPKTGNKFLTELSNNNLRKSNKIKNNPEWSNFNSKKKQIYKKMKEDKISNFEQVSLLETLYPQVKGGKNFEQAANKLTYSELSRVERFVNKRESDTVYDYNLATLVPDDLKTRNRFYDKFREYTLSTAAFFEPLGYTGQKIAKKLEQFSMWRTNVMGTVVTFEKNMNSELRKHGIYGGLSEVNEHIQIMRDPKYAGQRNSKKHKDFLKKLEGIEVIKGTKFTSPENLEQWIMNRYDDFFDIMATTLISSNSWIRNINKQGEIKSSKFLHIVGKDGKEIKLVDIYKNPELFTDQVESFLKFAKKEQNKVLNDKGEIVAVDRKKSKSYYQGRTSGKDSSPYSPRMISEEFMQISDLANRDARKAIHDLMAQPEIADLKVSTARKEEIARQMFNEILSMQDARGVYGGQWGRVADLPSHYYLKTRDGSLPWEKNNMSIIEVENVVKPNGELYKKGEFITDIKGKKHKVEEVVPVYETDYNKILKKYADGISHSTAAYHTYGVKVRPEIVWKPLAESIGKEMNDNYYSKFAEKVIKNQLFGEARTDFDKIFRPMARISAITGLSSPVSSVKNLLLGNVQNATVFNTRELMQNLYHLSSRKNWNTEKAMTLDAGHSYIGSYDLFLAKQPFRGANWLRKIVENAGGMQTTEYMNRLFAGSFGPFTLKNAVDNLAGIKNLGTYGVSQANSRRIMIDVFKFTPSEIKEMISRRVAAGKDGRGMEYKSTELQRARYRSQLVTQGSGDIPYVPYWMGKQWAKPLTLFYRVAYRMTDTTANNVLKPIIVDGNMIPAMKYFAGTVATGFTMFQLYDWVLDEERVNKFKSMPNNMLEYFIKAEGLGLFSNAFGEYGSAIDSYEPVVVRNAKSFTNMLVGMTKEALRGEPEFALKEADEGITEVVAAYNFYKRAWDRVTGDNQKQFKDSKRRQSQFLDAFYPKEKLDIDYDNGATSKTAYYKAIRDSFWVDDNKIRARQYYAALHMLVHNIMTEKGYDKHRAKKEATQRLKRTITRMRPVPSSWRKTRGASGKSKYNEYYSSLPKELKEQEENLDSLYLIQREELIKSISQYKKLYDTESY